MSRRAQKITMLAGAAIACAFFTWRLAGPSLAKSPQKLGAIPEFSAKAATIAGQRILSRGDLLGAPWVANFIFTRCAGPCPLLSTRMAALQDGLPAAVHLVSFTVDPDRDDVARLEQYAKHYGAKSERWLFARMEKKELYNLVFAGFRLPVMANPEQDSGYRVTHTTKLVLVDEQGEIRGYYDGADEASLAQIRRDIQRLTQEAGRV